MTLAARSVLLLALYGAAFTALRSTASDWQMGILFSLWFPAAGLRFAFLWFMGPRWTVPAAFAELFVQLAAGEVEISASPIATLAGVLGPCLLYGTAIHYIQTHIADKSPVLGLWPMPFALGTVAAPLLGCLGALPWAIPRAMEAGAFDAPTLLSSLLIFALGDALGILVLAPPLVWIADYLTGRGFPKVLLDRQIALEVTISQALAWALVWGMWRAGYGFVLAPILLAGGWTGIRMGRVGGWIAIVVSAAILLPLTASGVSDPDRIRVHMLIATLAAIAYLAGAFADSQRKVRASLRRRDRLLYQAERLKTLRGMSVAVIHEISQPLSTIEIEADNLSQIAATPNPDLEEMRDGSSLVARKARDLSNLIRQLRRFGEKDDAMSQDIMLSSVLREVRRIAEPGALQRNVTLSFPYLTEHVVHGYDIEIRQAILNLVNNAIAAAPDCTQVTVRADEVVRHVEITVTNQVDPQAARRSGMGVGLIVARSIAEAHGGRLKRHITEFEYQCVIQLPLVGEGEGEEDE
jgi:two-component system sensor kinase FixL